MPACQGPQATMQDADVDNAASFLGYLYIVSQYTVRPTTPYVWHILCLRNSSSVPYFRQPPNLPTAARRNRKCTECGTTAFDRNRMSAESGHLSTFGNKTETEAEIRSTTIYRSSSSSRIWTGRQVWMLYQCLHPLDLAVQLALLRLRFYQM